VKNVFAAHDGSVARAYLQPAICRRKHGTRDDGLRARRQFRPYEGIVAAGEMLLVETAGQRGKRPWRIAAGRMRREPMARTIVPSGRPGRGTFGLAIATLWIVARRLRQSQEGRKHERDDNRRPPKITQRRYAALSVAPTGTAATALGPKRTLRRPTRESAMP